MNIATRQPTHRSVTAAADRKARMPCGRLSVLACALLLAAGVGFAQTNKRPDATPPFLSESVAPNLVITLDDSSSMVLAFFGPDTVSNTRTDFSRWLASPDANPVYYQPGEDYPPPLQPDGSPYAVESSYTDVFVYPFRGDGTTDEASGSKNCPAHHINLDQNFSAIWKDDAGPADVCAPNRVEGSELPEGRPYHFPFVADNEYWVAASQSGMLVPYDARQQPDAPKRYVSCAVAPHPSYAMPECIRCGDAHAQPNYNTPDPCFGDAQEVPEAQMPAFTRWYKFYRTRMHTVKTALTRVLPDLPDNVRVTYQGLMTDAPDYYGPFGLTPGEPEFEALVQRFDLFQKHRTAGYLDADQGVQTLSAWVREVRPTIEGTLLGVSHIRAGEFVSQGIALADTVSEYAGTAGVDPLNMCGAKCRHNFHLMVADGEWSDWWVQEEDFLGGVTIRWPTGTGAQDPSGETWIAQNQDGQSLTLPTTVSSPFGKIDYTPRGPYKDDNVGMLADAAFYYWARDLLPGVANEVPPVISHVEPGSEEYDEVNFWDPRNDPADWQHLTLFTVGFGLDNGITITYDAQGNVVPPFGNWQTGNDTAALDLESSGFPSCVAAPYDYDGEATVCDLAIQGSDGSRSIPVEAKGDDLFHAALNARGRYFSASRPEALVESLRSALNAVAAAAEQATSNSPVAITAGSLSDTTRVYQAVTNSEDWTGEVRGVRVSTGYNCSPKLRGEFCEDLDVPYQTTKSEDSFPDWSLRKIYTMADGTPTVFDSDNLSIAQQSALMTCGDDQNPSVVAMTPQERAEACIDWLRGKEIDGFRERETLLGDILGSGPVVVGPPRALFSDPDGQTDLYQKFKTERAKRPTMIYVGANDGMLHAFNADSEAPKLEEVFAYVPEAVYANLADLTQETYGDIPPKQAFVDGPISIADAKFSRDGSSKPDWATVLVGALGAGAQGLYALDITDPTTDAADDLILWEFSDASGSDDDDGKLDGRDMGYNIWKPAIVRIADPEDAGESTWVVLVGNGFASTEVEADGNPDEDLDGVPACTDSDDSDDSPGCTISQTGNAVLYVLNLGGPDADRIRARLDTGKGDVAAPNGLAEVSTLDTNGDLIADRAYAGDLYGNVWRFDLTKLDAPTLMFSAKDANGNAQPITSRIVFTRHPLGGYMLLFGTGRFVYESDKIDKSVQTFYGIWDRQGLDFGDGPISSEKTPPIRADLMQHELIEVVNVSGVGGGIVSRGRTSTKQPISAPSVSPRGWMIDLVMPDASPEGERVVVAPQVRRGHVTFVSMIPGDCCEAGGSSWINTLDAIDGSRPDYIPFDYDRDGGIDQDDLLPVQGGQEIGTSIQLESGIYSAGSRLDMGDGQSIDIHGTSDAQTVDLADDTGLSSARTWLQLD